MEEGSLRADVNVSVRKVGDTKLGTRTEMKNMNSFKSITRAIDYEVTRQIDVLEEGGKVEQETLRWDDVSGKTFSMRDKEDAQDYRYFPDPDLVAINLSDEYIEDIKNNLPELPESRKERYINKYHQKQKDSTDYLKNLKILEYDILYGDHDIYGGENPYQATDLKMGTDEIKITDAYEYSDHICVEGENFNTFSVVFVNDKECTTVAVNGNMLIAKGIKLKKGDKVSVVQRGKDKIELSRVTFEN